MNRDEVKKRIKRLYKRHRILILFTFIIICGGNLFGYYLLAETKNNENQKLLEKVTVTAASIDPTRVMQLQGNSGDLSSPDYQHLKDQIAHVGDVTHNEIYIIRIVNGKPYFLLNSIEPNNVNYASPGEEYIDPPKTLLDSNNEKKSKITNVYKDGYGTFVSAFVPIMDPDGNVVGIVCGDIGFSQYMKEVYSVLVYPMLTDFLAIVILLLIYFYFDRLLASRNALMKSLARTKHEKAKADLLISLVGEPLIVCEPKGGIKFCNKIAEKVLHCKFEDIKDKLVRKVFEVSINGIPIATGQELVSRVVMEKNVISVNSLEEKYEIRYVESSKKISFMATASPIIVNDNVEAVIIIFNDISEILRVNRMKSDFISLASHQLRTPLAKTRWMIEMLIDDKSKPASKSQSALMNSIYETNQRLITLVSSLLNISRIESGRIAVNPEQTDLAELIRKIIKNYEHFSAKKGQAVNFSVDDSVPKINVDQKMIREVYNNLIDNAIKYTPNGGIISLKLERDGDKIISTVSDNGYGIPNDDKEKIFQRFFRASNIVRIESDGTGLGLYLAKIIVESSGGKLWFESEERKGTAFHFSIPVTGQTKKEGAVTIETTL